MKVTKIDPPRVFHVGVEGSITISDCARVHLDANEQVTFVTEDGKEHDFARKSWGYYATPSVNGRLVDQGFKTALVRNAAGRVYVIVVEAERLAEFNEYVQRERLVVEEWLDERR